MNGTPVTVVGNVATAVDFRTSAGGVPYARFRLACSTRRFDRQREEWVGAGTSFYTVWTWRTLATNVASSVAVGEPVVVHGRLRILEEEKDGGGRYVNAEVTASAVGHDMTRGTSAFVRGVTARPDPAGAPRGAGGSLPGPAGGTGTAGAGTAGRTGSPGPGRYGSSSAPLTVPAGSPRDDDTGRSNSG